MKIFRFILFFFILVQNISFSQDTVRFDTWSVGVSFSHFKYSFSKTITLYEYTNRFYGVTFEHKIYKNLYFKTGLEYSWHNKDLSSHKYNNKVLTVPTVIKWYCINSKDNIFHTSLLFGINNRYFYEYDRYFMNNNDVIYETDELGFYYVYGCGMNFNIKRINLGIEVLKYAPNISKYNIGLRLNPHSFGYKLGITYLF